MMYIISFCHGTQTRLGLGQGLGQGGRSCFQQGLGFGFGVLLSSVPELIWSWREIRALGQSIW